jgi:hypothetical protein
MSIRPVKRLLKSKPTIEGVGVHLRRALEVYFIKGSFR